MKEKKFNANKKSLRLHVVGGHAEGAYHYHGLDYSLDQSVVFFVGLLKAGKH